MTATSVWLSHAVIAARRLSGEFLRSLGRHREALMARTIDVAGVRELVDGGAQLVEVLPAQEYEELHLPGAISLPLKELDAPAGERLDRGRPVVVTAGTPCAT